jgi:hypothetical protein
MRWAEHVARMGEESKVYEVLVGQREGKRPLGRPRRRWEEGSEWILGRSAGGVDWIRMAQDMGLWRAVVNAVMNLRVLTSLSFIYIYVYMDREINENKRYRMLTSKDTFTYYFQ